MDRATFVKDSNSMGDFYMYYNREGRSSFTVATTDLSCPYIKNKARPIHYNPLSEVVVWSWQADRLIKVALTDIKKLTPLSAALKNYA